MQLTKSKLSGRYHTFAVLRFSNLCDMVTAPVEQLTVISHVRNITHERQS